MFINIDLYSPDKIIKCSELSNSSDIYSNMKKMNAESYAYCIAYVPRGKLKFEVLKFGKSSPDPDRTSSVQGERIARQVANLPGWSDLPTSDHGYDFARGVEQLKLLELLPKYMNKNDIIIGVWNTSYNFRGQCKSKFATDGDKASWLEGELCSQYKINNSGKLPPLNKRDPTNTVIYTNPIIFGVSTESGPKMGIELFHF